jgi:hypothetical protein
MLREIISNKYIAAFITTLIAFLYICLLIAKGVIHLDSGELAAVAATLGIAHPTGYPLFTMLGFLFTKLLFFLTPVIAVNVMAAVFTSGAIYFVVLIIHFLLQQYKKQDNNILVAASSGLLLAFSKTFWFQSTSVEVYSLHLFLITATIYVYLLATSNKDNIYFIKQPYWILFAVLFALCFTNHLTSI